jgi:hypothetical protein
MEKMMIRRLALATAACWSFSCSSPPDEGVDVGEASDEAENDLGNLTFQYKGGVMKQGWFDTPDGPQLLDYEEVNGLRLLQGDIGLPADEPDYRSGVVASVFGKAWPSAIVHYESTGLANNQMVLDGIRHIEERTVLRFIPGATTGNRIRFVDWTENYGFSDSVGMKGGAQVINLCSTCGWSAADGQTTVVHELGHAIGLFHEQQRTDRNSFVDIDLTCLKDQKHAGNFSTFGSSGFNFGPYDLISIMQYSSFSFAKPNCPTITAEDGSLIAQATTLSGWDTAGINSLYAQWHTPRIAVDYTGDGKVDLAVWRPGSGYLIEGRSTLSLGSVNAVPVPGYWDSPVFADAGAWEPATGKWTFFSPRNPTASNLGALGQRGDMPVPADYDGDGRTDIAVWGMSDGMWRYKKASTGATVTRQWGLSGDRPAPGDFDGDGKADFAVYRPTKGNWYVINSSTNTSWAKRWGNAGDIPVPADYDGDGKTDLAVFRPHNGTWYVINSRTNASWFLTHGTEGDLPVPGDYDGDGKADLIAFRPSLGRWFFRLTASGSSILSDWGTYGDVPVP